MNSLHINRIRVQTGNHPLKNYLEINPARNFNLIYGRNESGKTYLVEFLIKLLFGSGQLSGSELRDWDSSGEVSVLGLKESESEPVIFDGGKGQSDRFDGFFKAEGLPADFSKLLVVKSGEARLSVDKDGVGKGLLKDYLSGVGMLEAILDDKNISVTIKAEQTKILDNYISGNNRGEIKNYRGADEKRTSLNELLNRVLEYADGTIRDLTDQKNEKESQLARLDIARRHQGAKILDEIKAIRSELKNLPPDDALAKVNIKVAIHREKESEIQKKTVKLEKLSGAVDDSQWTEQAVITYEELLNQSTEEKSRAWPWVLAAFFFVVTVVSGFVDQPVGIGVGALLTMIFFVLHILGRAKQSADSGKLLELHNLGEEYQRRFGEPLSNLATLKAKATVLNAAQKKKVDMEGELNGLQNELRDIGSGIVEWFSRYFLGEAERESWEYSINKTKENRTFLERSIEGLEGDLDDKLKLRKEQCQHSQEDPDVVWDIEKNEVITNDLENIKGVLLEANEKNADLKNEVGAQVGQYSDDWHELIEWLEEKTSKASEEYKKITAELLAKICVKNTSNEFREREDQKITENLQDEALARELKTTTCGAYDRFEWDGEGLSVRSPEGHEYAVENLSSGAKDQVMMAIRIGFARRALGDRSAFLILDDAFQRADWERRPEMIQHTLQMVQEHGWQLFYFTMDDHIRDTFRAKANSIFGPDGYLYHSLSNGFAQKDSEDRVPPFQ